MKKLLSLFLCFLPTSFVVVGASDTTPSPSPSGAHLFSLGNGIYLPDAGLSGAYFSENGAQQINITAAEANDTVYLYNNYDANTLSYTNTVIVINGTPRASISHTTDRLGAQFGYSISGTSPQAFGTLTGGTVFLTTPTPTPTPTSDTTPPQLVTLGISPAQVNVTSASAMVTITARITDNLAGNAGEGYSSSPSQIRFKSPSGNQIVDAMLDGSRRVSGTALDGNYSYQMTVPQYAESGIWTIDSVLLVDQIGNIKYETAQNLAARSLPSSFVVTAPSPSVAPSSTPSGGAGGAPVTSTGSQAQKPKKGGGKSSASKSSGESKKSSSAGSSKKPSASKPAGLKKTGGKKAKKK